MGADAITSGIDPAAAENAGIGNRAYGFQVNGSLLAYRVLSLNVEGGIIGMSDENRFTQETTGGERTSGVAAGMGTISAGLATPPLSVGASNPLRLSAGINGGQSWVDINRTITNCADCHGEDVNVRAGRFWEPVLRVGIRRGELSARYRTYVGSSDFQNALMIGYATALRRRTPPAQ